MMVIYNIKPLKKHFKKDQLYKILENTNGLNLYYWAAPRHFFELVDYDYLDIREIKFKLRFLNKYLDIENIELITIYYPKKGVK